MCDKAKLKEILMEVFQSIDKDNSGSLEQSELEAVFKAYTDHPECPADFKAEHGSPDKIKGLCEQFVKVMDTSGDGKVTLDEFLKFFKCC